VQPKSARPYAITRGELRFRSEGKLPARSELLGFCRSWNIHETLLERRRRRRRWPHEDPLGFPIRSDDLDFYEFTTPSDSRGGYVTVGVTDVGPNGDITVEAFTALDNSSFHRVGNNEEGGSVFLFFNAKPGATFRIAVSKYLTVNAPNPYRFQAVYHPVADTYEPNDQRTQAASISVGQAVEGYMFAGWEVSTGIPSAEWQDWYQVQLAAGTTTVLLSIAAADVDGSVTLFNPAGTQVASQSNNTEGATVQLDYTVPTAGTYYLRVNPYMTPPVLGSTVRPSG
jgi:hypothetical protein